MRRLVGGTLVALSAGLGIALIGPACGTAQEEIVVTNALAPSITAYAGAPSGDVNPDRILGGADTGLSAPSSVAVDFVHDEMVVTNATNQSITVYARAASGNATPLRTLAGAGTGLLSPVSAVVNPFRDELIVANGFGQSITVYARTASANTAPIRVLAGDATGLAGPYALALDAVNQELAVTNMTNHSVTVYASTAGGNTPPLRTLLGADTGLAGPRGVAVDPIHGEILVANIAANSITVYDRAASGDAAPIRTLAGPSTGLALPVALAVDVAHDQLIVVSGGALQIFPRTAGGDTPPIRTIAGASTGLFAPTAVAVAAGSPLVAAVLPSSRSVQVGVPATAFATIINAGLGPVAGCALAPISSLAASFFFQTTEPVGNTPTGTTNAAANIAAGGLQTYVFGLTPTAPFDPSDVQIGFVCDNTNRAPVTAGLDTLLLVASATPVPDIVAQSATIGNTGIVNVQGAGGGGAFAVATSNVGAPGTITVSADTGGVDLPVSLFVCQTDPVGGGCMSSVAPSVTLDIPPGGTPTFGVFVAGNGVIPFDPAANRVFVRFTDHGVTRGATSVAVRTQ